METEETSMPLNIFQDKFGFPRIILTEPKGSSVEVLLHGAQIVSWKYQQKEELLFMSSKVDWKEPKAIKGGISASFPQFGDLLSIDPYGFTKSTLWSLDSDPSPLPPLDNPSSVDLVLNSTGVDFKTSFKFEFRLRISLSAGKLILIPRIRNIHNKAFSFAFELCNFLRVSDVGDVRIEGLETLHYLDNLMNNSRFTEQGDAITFEGEMDRVYLRSPEKIAIIDHEKRRTFELQKNAMPDTEVWNPGEKTTKVFLWEKKADALPDWGKDDFQTMICVKSAAIDTPIQLKPSEEWKGYQELSIVSSSYCSGPLDPRKVHSGFR